MFRSLARLVRAPLPKPESPVVADSSDLPPVRTPAATFSAVGLSSGAAARFDETAALLDRLSPQTAQRYRMQAEALVTRFGEPVFLAFSDLMRAAGQTRHVARLDDVHRRTLAALAAIAVEPDLCLGALRAVMPLYARRPLLGATALDILADHRELGVAGFSAWLDRARTLCGEDVVRLESFIGLDSRAARAALDACLPGLALADVVGTLRLFLRGLANRPFRIVAGDSDDPGRALDATNPVGGETLLTLPRRVALFDDREQNFILYKILAAQSAGRHLFGTFTTDAATLAPAYDETRNYFSGLGEGAGGLSHIDFAAARNTLIERALPARPEFATVPATLALFSDPGVARAIFEAVESARILARLRGAFRGVARDTDTLAAPLLASRKTLEGTHLTSAAVELLFRLALVGSVGGGVDAEYAVLTATLRDAIAPCLAPEATVADSLRATLEIYRLLPPPAQQRPGDTAIPNEELRIENGEFSPEVGRQETSGENPDSGHSGESSASEGDPETSSDENESVSGSETLNSQFSTLNYAYPEWDCRIGDYRADWCRVVETPLGAGVAGTIPALPLGAAAAIRREFERLRPKEPAWRQPLTDGEEVSMDAVVEHIVERRRRAVPSDRLYAARVRDRRSVAALVLLDMSRSTGEAISGADTRRIIDCEIESLVAFGTALDHIGDRFALCAFNSRGRNDVKFFHIKGFAESVTLPERLAALRPTDNTRLGAAVRHATRLLAREAARTKLLIVLSDGMPHDGDYGDVAYAVADSGRALGEARARGMKTLCVAVEAGRTDAHLTAMFGAGHFVCIRDPAELPNRLPRLYRRWTR